MNTGFMTVIRKVRLFRLFVLLYLFVFHIGGGMVYAGNGFDKGTGTNTGIWDYYLYIGGKAYSLMYSGGDYTCCAANNISTLSANLGNFPTTSSSCYINDARVSTWKTTGAGNVCSGSFNYRIYLQGTTAPAYSSVALSYNGSYGDQISGSSTNQQWTNTSLNINILAGLTQPGTYNFEYYYSYTGNDNGSSGCSNTYTTTAVTATFTFGTTYYWIGGTTSRVWNFNGAWSTSLGGSSAGAITPTAQHIYIIDGSNLGGGATGTGTVTGISGATMNVGQIILRNNATFNITPTSSSVLNINGGMGTDLSVPAGSTLTLGNSAGTFFLKTGATGSVAGTLNIGNGSNASLSVADANSLIFTGTANCNLNANTSSTYCFGSGGTTGAIVFQNGTKLTNIIGNDPFGGSGFNQVTFQTGSTYELRDGTSSQYQFNGKTFSNFIYNSSNTSASANFGSSGLYFDSVTVLQGTFVIGATGTTTNLNVINGNITVWSGATINFNPASASTFFLNGTTQQRITAAGTWRFGACSSQQNFTITNSAGVVLGSNISMATGTLQVNSGALLDAGLFTIGQYSGSCAGSDFKLLSGGSLITKNTLGITTAAGGTDGSTVQTKTRSYDVAGNYTYNNTTTAQATGNGLTGAATLTINNGSSTGVTLTNSISATTSLVLTSGILYTGANIISIPSGATVSRTSGWVNGNLRKWVVTGTPTLTYEVGGAASGYYSPISITFGGSAGSVSVAGYVTGKSTDNDHANITSSSLNPLYSANRNWTLTNNSITFNGTYSATFTFVNADLDAGVDPLNFIIGRYNSSWTYPTVGTLTSLTSQASALNNTEFGDFQLAASCSSIMTWKGGFSGFETEWNNGNNWTCGSVPTSTTTVIIPNTTYQPVISTANAFAKNIYINTGASLTMSGSVDLTISSGGVFSNSSSSTAFNATASTGNLKFAGPSTSTISGTNTFNNVTTNGGLNFGSSSTLNGTFTIGSSGYVTGNAPLYGSSSVLKYASGGTYGRSLEWSSTSGAGYPANVQVSKNGATATILDLGANSGASTARQCSGNLTIDDGCTFTMATTPMTASLTVNGNVVINAGSSLIQSTTSGSDINVGGNWTRLSTGTYTTNGRAVFFTGTGTQVIQVTGGGTETFAYLGVNQSVAGNLQLSNSSGNLTNVTVSASTSDVLQLLNGNIDLNGQTMTLSGNGGNIKVNGGVRTITGSSGSVLNLNGNKTVTSSSGGSLTTDVNVTVKAGGAISFGFQLTTIKGTLEMAANGFVTSNNAPYYFSGSTLSYNCGCSFLSINSNTNEWLENTSGDTWGVPYHVIINRGTNLSFSTTSYVHDMRGDLTIGYGNSGSASQFTLGSNVGGDLSIAGNWNRTANGVFNANDRAVYFVGTTDATITANNGEVFPYMFLNKSTNKTLSLLDSVTITKSVGFVSGILDLKDKNFTLASDASNTARVSTITTPANVTFTYSGTGRFVVQRYFPGKRSWRLVTSPLSNTGSIFDNWQAGAPATYTPGIGMFVTGPSPTGASGNGLDYSTQNNYSMKGYANNVYVNIGNTKTTNLSGNGSSNANVGYFTFVRGDRRRSPDNTILGNYNNTTLSSKGKLQYGSQSFTVGSSSGNFELVGNPYPAPVNFNSIGKTNVFNRRFYVYDPNFGYVGAFVVMEDYGSPGTFYPSNINTSTQDNYIQSGQAIFVLPDGSGNPATLDFDESNKATTNNTNIFRPAQLPFESFRANLYMTDAGSSVIADGALVQFDDAFKATVDIDDALKFTNVNENLGLTRNNSFMCVERRPLIKETDTLFLRLTKTTPRKYSFEFVPDKLDHDNLAGFLEDSYLKSSTPLYMNGPTKVDFTIDGTPGSLMADRFRIVFRPSVKIFEFTATLMDNDVQLNWNVGAEINLKEYTIERSTDGLQFIAIATIAAAGSAGGSNYQWTDAGPEPNWYYYRVKSISNHGVIAYSETRKVKVVKANPSVYVYPNPVKGKQIQLQLNKMPEGLYQYRILNQAGQLITKGSFRHSGGSATIQLFADQMVTFGKYSLEIIPNGQKSVFLPVIFAP